MAHPRRTDAFKEIADVNHVDATPLRREFNGWMAGVAGLVMTKLDGTARGGILVANADKFKLPVHFIGVGEGVDDLEPFAARDFARAIAGVEGGE